MKALVIGFFFGYVVSTLIRWKRHRQVPDGNFLSDELCNEARTKYPSMKPSDALDMLYRDYFDKITLARNKGEDVTEFIEARQLIAQERAHAIMQEAQSSVGFEVVHSAQA